MTRNLFDPQDAEHTVVGTGDNFRIALHPFVRRIKYDTYTVQYFVEFERDGVVARLPNSMSVKRAMEHLKSMGVDHDSLTWDTVKVEPSEHSPWATWTDARSGVYFIEANGTGLVKIGYGNPVRSRYELLRAASPYPLQLRCIVPGDAKTEREFHKRFKAYHHYNEWFRIEGELADFIAAHK